ncbi:MAG: GH116 family glycosyl hydrolase [Pirellulaceae bacterium]
MGTSGPWKAIAGPFEKKDTVDHFVPLDKKLNADWVKDLFAKGQRTWYRGNDLKTIGMPVGGVCAGQVYLTGDGRLVYWGIFNQNFNSGYGNQKNYVEGRQPTDRVTRESREFVATPAMDQGFAVRVTSEGKSVVRSLDRHGFADVRFCGEYPIGYVEYSEAGCPITAQLEAFSPFIPLNAADSALPATVLNYTLRNTSDEPVNVDLVGWLGNSILHYSGEQHVGEAMRVNRVVRGDGVTHLSCRVIRREQPPKSVRQPTVFADFEANDYGDWIVEGEAFGSGPAPGTLERQQRVGGFRGKGLVNTFLDGDPKHGKLTSPAFTIDRPYISFLIGGGAHTNKTCIHLVVDGDVVRTAMGKDNERLQPHNWNVKELQGKQAKIEIVDAESSAWGHINIDQIEFRDDPMVDGVGDMRQQPDHGTMGLALLSDSDALSSPCLPAGPLPDLLFDGDELATDGDTQKPLDESLRGALGVTCTLGPGETRTLTFVVSWCMPNLYQRDRNVSQYYATRFRTAADVARYIARHADRLATDTRLWHDTYYDSTLPHWLLDRLHSTVANLATTTCHWWADGRFWAWEGCGCCHGTCGHVWNYEHALARLFPDLERSTREMQDFAPGVGLVEETGEIRFRGEGGGIWAGDSQGGYILKAYREHQMSSEDGFLKKNWKQIKKAVEFLIEQDADADGLIEGRQHQTYDQDYYGANTFVGSLYLGALRAAEEMAHTVGEPEFAATCRKIFEAGQKNSVQRLFNGEYFIQDVDLEKHEDWQYADGCLADQMFGQGWAHQVGLGYVYPKETVLKSLKSIWEYCWAPDVKHQNDVHAPARWFAFPGEAGLFTCTWPKSKHLGPKSTRYRNEVWTGIEYQVANHMAYEGMLTEALAICRAIHDRYHPSKRNPFNEIECGDHYARAMASWGVLLGLAGAEYHGPKKQFGFAPRMTPEEFRAVFTAAEGWGTIRQQRHGDTQTNTIEVKWGQLPVATLTFALPRGRQVQKITIDGATSGFAYTQEEDRVTIEFSNERCVAAGEQLKVELM